jgi:hypothetical protein
MSTLDGPGATPGHSKQICHKSQSRFQPVELQARQASDPGVRFHPSSGGEVPGTLIPIADD